MATDPTQAYPSDLPALALRETVVFPLTLQPLAISRPISIEAVNRALASDRLIFLSLQTSDNDDPTPNDLKPIGTIAAIRQMAKAPSGGIHVDRRRTDARPRRPRLAHGAFASGDRVAAA